MDTWSEWSQCTRECSGGYQVKIRSCSQSSSCIGSSVVQRACNTQPCSGEWACWSDWSNCDGRSLKKHRTRHCKSVNGVLSGDRTSPLCSAGTSYEEMPCDGWDNWTPWSQCDLATGQFPFLKNDYLPGRISKDQLWSKICQKCFTSSIQLVKNYGAFL